MPNKAIFRQALMRVISGGRCQLQKARGTWLKTMRFEVNCLFGDIIWFPSTVFGNHKPLHPNGIPFPHTFPWKRIKKYVFFHFSPLGTWRLGIAYLFIIWSLFDCMVRHLPPGQLHNRCKLKRVSTVGWAEICWPGLNSKSSGGGCRAWDKTLFNKRCDHKDLGGVQTG